MNHLGVYMENQLQTRLLISKSRHRLATGFLSDAIVLPSKHMHAAKQELPHDSDFGLT